LKIIYQINNSTDLANEYRGRNAGRAGQNPCAALSPATPSSNAIQPGLRNMTMPAWCESPIASDLIRAARAEVMDPFPRQVLADWLERIDEPDALEMCRVLRASFDCDEIVHLQSDAAKRLYPIIGARRGWFFGQCIATNDPMEKLWLASPCSIELPGGFLLEFEYIPSGTFIMGSPPGEKGRRDNENQHQVTIQNPFYMGKYLVTRAHWNSALEIQMDKNLLPKDGSLPCIVRGWENAMTFCGAVGQLTRKNIMIPTEAQWEYACRAGSTTPFHFGEELDGTQANCNGFHPYGTRFGTVNLARETLVGSYPPNPWGLFDMHGNLWEICADWNSDYPGEGKSVYASGGSKRRASRGGCWESFGVGCRSAERYYDNNYRMGIRVMMEA